MYAPIKTNSEEKGQKVLGISTTSQYTIYKHINKINGTKLS